MNQCLNEIHQRNTEYFYEEKSVVVEITLSKLQYSSTVYCAINERMKCLILLDNNYLWPLIIQRFRGLFFHESRSAMAEFCFGYLHGTHPVSLDTVFFIMSCPKAIFLTFCPL